MWPFPKPGSGRGSQPAAAARYAVIDTELTGLDERRDSIVSLGGLRVARGRIDLADRYYAEAEPASRLTPASIVIHGITPDEARGRPAIGGLLEGFRAFCAGDVIVGHFVEIDLLFLARELSRAGLPPLANRSLDTWAIYDWLSSRAPHLGGPGLARLRDPRLPELAEALGVPRSREHHALADAFVTAQVFQRLLLSLPRWGVASLGQLLRIGDPRRAAGGNYDGAVPLA